MFGYPKPFIVFVFIQMIRATVDGVLIATLQAGHRQIQVARARTPRAIPEKGDMLLARQRKKAPPKLPMRMPFTMSSSREWWSPGFGEEPSQPKARPLLALGLGFGAEVLRLGDSVPKLLVGTALPHLVQHGVRVLPAAWASEGRRVQS